MRGAKGRKRHNALFHLFENASKVGRCTTKFSQLPHMRTSISPAPWLVYIPLNRSTGIRTFKKGLEVVWEAQKAEKGIMHCFTCLKMRRKCADVPRNSPNFHTCAQVWNLILGFFASHWTGLHALEHLRKSAGRVRGAKGRKRNNVLFRLFENASKLR